MQLLQLQESKHLDNSPSSVGDAGSAAESEAVRSPISLLSDSGSFLQAICYPSATTGPTCQLSTWHRDLVPLPTFFFFVLAPSLKDVSVHVWQGHSTVKSHLVSRMLQVLPQSPFVVIFQISGQVKAEHHSFAQHKYWGGSAVRECDQFSSLICHMLFVLFLNIRNLSFSFSTSPSSLSPALDCSK